MTLVTSINKTTSTATQVAKQKQIRKWAALPTTIDVERGQYIWTVDTLNLIEVHQILMMWEVALQGTTGLI